MATEEALRRSTLRRNRYKELLERGSEIVSKSENKSAVATLKEITEVAICADSLNAQGRFQDRVENTTGVVMDAQVTKMTHELLGTVIQTMENTEISDDEFVAAINRIIGPNKNWDKLAEMSAEISRTFTYSQPLFGTFDEETVIPQKTVKERRKNASTNNSQQVKPTAITQQKKEEQQQAKSINALVTQINQLYRDNNEEALPFYKLVVDPKNYMRTIQNAFKCSFLLRDDALVIEEDEHGYPTIRPAHPSEKGENTREGTRQVVANFSMKLWNEMIQRYDITESMICWPDD